MSEYKPTFCVIPHRILYLEGLQLSYLKVYEVFFQFWNHGKTCFLSNPAICERTGLADSTVREALAFFEKRGEMRRKTQGSKRYLLPPAQAIEIEEKPVDKCGNNSSNNEHPAEIAAPTRCQVGGLPAAKSAHNNNKLNNKNLIKSFCLSDEQKKTRTLDNAKRHSWADKLKSDSPRADVTKQSTSYNPDDQKQTTFNPNSPSYQAFINSVPNLRRKHEKQHETD